MPLFNDTQPSLVEICFYVGKDFWYDTPNSPYGGMALDKHPFDRDDLEFNDGLGDLLRERETHEFSLKKASLSLILILLVIFVLLVLGFNLSKKVFKPKETTVEFVDITKEVSENTEIAQEAITEEVQPTQETQIQETKIEKTTPKPEIKAAEKQTSKPEKQGVKPVAKAEQPKPDLKAKSVDKADVKAEKPVHQAGVNISYKPKATVVAPRSVAPTPRPVATQPLTYKLIVGTFANPANADAVTKQLQAHGRVPYVWKDTVNGVTVYRVQAGAYPSSQAAAGDLARVKAWGFSDAYLLNR